MKFLAIFWGGGISKGPLSPLQFLFLLNFELYTSDYYSHLLHNSKVLCSLFRIFYSILIKKRIVQNFQHLIDSNILYIPCVSQLTPQRVDNTVS